MTPPSPADPLTPDKIERMARGFQSSRIVLTAVELRLFNALEDSERDAAALAKSLKTDPRATTRLLDALCALGLLEKREGKYRNAPAASACLVEGKPGYLGGLDHAIHLWDTWSHLTESVRQGQAVGHREIDDRGPQWLEAFIEAMHRGASVWASETVSLLDLSGVRRILDVGGGSGAYAMEMVRRAPGAKATVFDLPNVLPITRKYIAQAGMEDRVDTRPGDYRADDLGREEFDLVFLSSIIHIQSLEQNRELIAQCARALRPGGQVAVKDFIMDEDRTAPVFGAIFALNMLVGTESGDTFTEGEVRDWMCAAGLGDIRRADSESGIALVIGRKP